MEHRRFAPTISVGMISGGAGGLGIAAGAAGEQALAAAAGPGWLTMLSLRKLLALRKLLSLRKPWSKMDKHKNGKW